MKTKHYFIRNAERPKLPIRDSILIYLVMDKFNASLLAWGILGTLLAIIWLIKILVFGISEGVELIDPKTGKLK